MALGIYVHIPFCKQKCLYCDFNSYARKEELIEKYVTALQKEIMCNASNETVDSIFFGGGTPTILKSEQLLLILKAIKDVFNLSFDCEITIECNPGTVTKETLRVLQQSGFNRLSIGLQSSNNEELIRLGRIHSYENFLDCYHLARMTGFANISVDLMYGLPDQTMNQWVDTLKNVIHLKPEHISCYGLRIEPGTPFASMSLQIPDEDLQREMYDVCVCTLHHAGYARYEISNFSKNGFESRHNQKYWCCDDFLGFGAGAYSCHKQKRFNNEKDIQLYCDMVFSNSNAMAETICLSSEDQMSEFCFLGLRMTNGISSTEFKHRFQCDIHDVFGEVLDKNLMRGTMSLVQDRYKIKDEWLYVSNAILSDFV